MSLGRIVVVMIGLVVVGVAIWMVSLAGPTPAPAASPPRVEDPLVRLRVEVLGDYPHDPTAYTQGLLWQDGFLFESTGQYGQSSVRRVDLETGGVVESRDLPPEMFGEGLAMVEDRLIQLTWREGAAVIWGYPDLDEVGRLSYEGEGWGLCYDGNLLVMSDGSSRLTLRDPDTFEVVRRIFVQMEDGSVGRLNELECVDGAIYANVYTTDWIVQIDSESGRVEAVIDASGLLSATDRQGVDVLNGIAYDPRADIFYLTGKLWPKLFAVRFVATPAS
jgi:glutamine cyclotransferase